MNDLRFLLFGLKPLSAATSIGIWQGAVKVFPPR